MRVHRVAPRQVLNVLRRVGRRLDAWRGDPVPGQNLFEFRGPSTTVQFHGQGLGDLMIIRQFGMAFAEYLREHGDPELGTIAIACGGYKAAYKPEPADVNCYWWWSFGPYDDEPEQYLEYYLNETSVDPDTILCLSEQCIAEAEQLGYDTLFLPLGTWAFEPLGGRRSGLGFAGSRGHKQREKEKTVLDPVADRDDFEWVSDFVTPTQLNLWYNTRLMTFGLTKEGQRQWGMVNNRVFETLASGTPLVLESHPTVDDILGFEYPYQTGSPEETLNLVERIEMEPEETLDEFAEYARRVRERHSYLRRVETLVDHFS